MKCFDEQQQGCEKLCFLCDSYMFKAWMDVLPIAPNHGNDITVGVVEQLMTSLLTTSLAEAGWLQVMHL